MLRSVIVILMVCAMVPLTTAAEPESAISSELPFAGNSGSGSLTTLFAANGGYAGNMFDIEPLVYITDIPAIDVNWGLAGEKILIQVFYKAGTCVGFAEDPSAWTLLGSGVATSEKKDTPTHIELNGSAQFQAGKIYGMYVHAESYPTNISTLAYTNSTKPTVYENSDLKLTIYYGKGYPAFGATFTYRAWNGTIYYETGSPLPLSVYPDEISAWYGGQAEFTLNGGVDLAHRNYALFGTFSGTSPGTTLPGGLTLPINWDVFTDMVLMLAVAGNPLVDGFVGQLDAGGAATATLTLPGHTNLVGDYPANFAWCTYNAFDFVSNDVELMVTGKPQHPAVYKYDDGTSENALGWTAGGDSVWAHLFDAGPGDTLTTVHSTFGASVSSNGPPNGDPCWVYVWNDPNNDGDPVDGVLVGEGSGVIANSNTNTFNEYILNYPTPVEANFFAACHCWQDVGVYAAPMDEDTPYVSGMAWFMGGSIFDKTDLSTTAIYEMGSIGFPAFWLLRADND